MLCFPQLFTGAVGQFPIVKQRLSRTVVNESDYGVTVKLADAAAAAAQWELTFETLSDDERAALTDLHSAVEGRLGAFTFLDPTDNLLVWSEKLDEPAWERNSLLTVTAGVADPDGGTRASRISSAGAGPLAIQQVVNGPGWFRYAFGLAVRSDLEQQIRLIRSTATQTHSALFPIGPAWRRILLSGKFDGSEESVTFGIELGAGGSAEVFEAQAEAQAGASGYKKTLSAGGVYPAARFVDDELTVTADGPGRHSCKVRIHSRA